MISLKVSFSLMAVAFLVTNMAYPHVLAFARKHNIVDNPNARKLQRVPVPVMGGTAVYIGFLITTCLTLFFAPDLRLVKIMFLLSIMYAIGVWDDIKDVSAPLRFLVEVVVVWLMMYLLGVEINDFHGFWGKHLISDVVSIPLSLIAGVGIMNAINLIDGVDGYCSTFGVMACTAFAVIFFFAGDMQMFTLALITIGAVVPFFFHNVFGRTSKMFLGDGGSLMLGTLLAMFTFSTLCSTSPCAAYGESGLSLVALTLAILAVPVFDTLRVMIFRVINGHSPFRPDKTHLHHLYIEMNFSHLATSGSIVFVNANIIGILILAWRLGLSIDMQVYLVVLLAMGYTWGFYFFMESQHRKNDGEGSRLYQRWCVRGKSTNVSANFLWQMVRSMVDSRFLAGPAPEKRATEPKIQKTKGRDPRIQ